MMVIDNKFNIGDIVYLKTDPDQKARMVVKLSVSQAGVLYMLSVGASESWHFDIEIATERDVLKAVI